MASAVVSAYSPRAALYRMMSSKRFRGWPSSFVGRSSRRRNSALEAISSRLPSNTLRPQGRLASTLSSRATLRSSSPRAFFNLVSAVMLAVMSVRMEMYFSTIPSLPRCGAMKVSTQYRRPDLARLQTWPRHDRPCAMACHMSSQNSGGCSPELMRRWFWPSNSDRLYSLMAQKASLTWMMVPARSAIDTIACWFRVSSRASLVRSDASSRSWLRRRSVTSMWIFMNPISWPSASWRGCTSVSVQ